MGHMQAILSKQVNHKAWKEIRGILNAGHREKERNNKDMI